jgi:hypothetical protein
MCKERVEKLGQEWGGSGGFLRARCKDVRERMGKL